MLPEDIHPVSRCRLPPPKREDFDDAGKAVFDTYVDPKGGSIRGLQGPGGIQLYSPKLAEINRPGNKYLRFDAAPAARARGRHPDHRARMRQPLRVGGARARIAHVRRAGIDDPGDQAPALARRCAGGGRDHHPARPRNVRQAQGFA